MVSTAAGPVRNTYTKTTQPARQSGREVAGSWLYTYRVGALEARGNSQVKLKAVVFEIERDPCPALAAISIQK